MRTSFNSWQNNAFLPALSRIRVNMQWIKRNNSGMTYFLQTGAPQRGPSARLAHTPALHANQNAFSAWAALSVT